MNKFLKIVACFLAFCTISIVCYADFFGPIGDLTNPYTFGPTARVGLDYDMVITHDGTFIVCMKRALGANDDINIEVN